MNRISEKYRKYIIEIKHKGEKKLFVSGMNLMNDEVDFLLLNKSNEILLFDNFSQIERCVLESENIIDKDNFHKWLGELENCNPYVSYDLDEIVEDVVAAKRLNEISKNELSYIIDLLNLVGDYSYQVKSTKLLLLFEDKIMDLFKSIYLDNYIWKTSESNNEYKFGKQLNDFPYLEFKEIFEKMFFLFSKKLINYTN